MKCPCGSEISEARLKAMPGTRKCVLCQAKSENGFRKREIPMTAMAEGGELEQGELYDLLS